MGSNTVLSSEDKEFFLTNGYIHLKDCFSREQAQSIIHNVWTRLGMEEHDKSTWSSLRTHLPNHNTFDAAAYAPKAWDAICELTGGEERLLPTSKQWRDGLIVSLGSPEFEGQEQNLQELDGWHVDGDFFIHYLDSPEQGLLVIPLFTDIAPGGGGTAICPDSIPKIAKHLHDHPEGVSPRMTPRGHADFRAEKNRDFFNGVAKDCERFVEVTGDCGDVYLLHPLMLHSASRNPRRMLRIITNPPVGLKEPFQFDRADGNYSIVEQATLKALGKDSLPGWAITGHREPVVPERLKAQAKFKEEELKRLEAARQASEVAA